MKNNETIMWIVIAIAVILVFSGFGMMGFPFGGMMYGSFGFPLFGWLFMILITVALVFLIIWLFQQIQNPRKR